MIDSPHKDIKLIILNRFKGLKTVYFLKKKSMRTMFQQIQNTNKEIYIIK